MMTAVTSPASDTSAPAKQSRRSSLGDLPWPELAAPFGLLGLVLIFSLLNEQFFTLANLEAVLAASAILILLAVGQTFVIATGGIDLSIASMMTLGAVVLGLTYGAGNGIVVSLVAGVAAAGLAGVINGLLISRGRITDFIVTLGMLSAASGLALILSDGRPQPVTDGVLLRFVSGGIGPFSWPFLVAIAIAGIAHVVLFHTRFGLHVLATGGNTESARETGVKTLNVKLAVYTISGLMCGIAAVLLVARVGAAEPAVNTQFLLNGIAAFVLGGVKLVGGRATILGPVAGALLLQTLVNGLTLQGLSQFYHPLAVGIVVVAAAFLVRFQR
jgi:ribose/xylose/arabinose/galactoside ABC-type transport system permease subunit